MGLSRLPNFNCLVGSRRLLSVVVTCSSLLEDYVAALHMTFLGHQTWHISDGQVSVLLDPILKPMFGLAELPFEVWPPRTVDIEAMPAPSAVILSHERPGNFHLPSLNLLDKSTPIYTGMTFPAVAVEAIIRLGFSVRRVDFTAPLRLGRMEITLYPAAADSSLWESRSAQPLVRLIDHPHEEGVFLGAGAHLSDAYLAQIASGIRPRPRMAVVSHSTPSIPSGALGLTQNLLDGPDQTLRTTGLEILHDLLISYLDPLPGLPAVALCGNGYLSPDSPHGPFLYSDHRELAEQANRLQNLFTVYGPRPGNTLILPIDGPITMDPVDWVHINLDLEAIERRRLTNFIACPRQVEPKAATCQLDERTWGEAANLLERELPTLASSLISTRMGNLMSGMHEYRRRPLNENRMVLRLLDPPGRPGDVECWALDVTSPRFVSIAPAERQDDLARYPFGVELFYQDLLALLEGRVQVWEIVSHSAHFWYVGDTLDSPAYALLAVLGERQRPDLPAGCYRQSLNVPGTAG